MDNIMSDKPSLQNKFKAIKDYFEGKIVVIAYSGGVDSTVIAELAHKFAQRSVTVTADSITVLPGEVEKALQLAKDRGWEHRIVQINELKDENFASNPTNRCYYCKAGLSEQLEMIAQEVKADIIVEGTNISEVKGYRPGFQALQEKNIESPFVLHNITKEDIRELAHSFNLPNADKPSLACLSSRFPYGDRITADKLRRVGKAEQYLIDKYKLNIIRVRDHNGLARIEVGSNELHILLQPEIFENIHHKFVKNLGFTYVAIDCIGYRTGSLNETLESKTIKENSNQSITINID